MLIRFLSIFPNRWCKYAVLFQNFRNGYTSSCNARNFVKLYIMLGLGINRCWYAWYVYHSISSTIILRFHYFYDGYIRINISRDFMFDILLDLDINRCRFQWCSRKKHRGYTIEAMIIHSMQKAYPKVHVLYLFEKKRYTVFLKKSRRYLAYIPRYTLHYIPGRLNFNLDQSIVGDLYSVFWNVPNVEFRHFSTEGISMAPGETIECFFCVYL